jgi:hypothetical protein
MVEILNNLLSLVSVDEKLHATWGDRCTTTLEKRLLKEKIFSLID